MSPRRASDDAPAAFKEALAALDRAKLRPEVALEHIDAPYGLASHAVAVAAEVTGATEPGGLVDELATGRFVLLYEPEGNPLWAGTFRIVTFIRATLDPQMGNDQLLGSVAWTWLVDALDEHSAPYTEAGGTATRVLSENFGTLTGKTEHIDIELRASWTPLSHDVTRHLEAWVDMVASFAGLPPLPDGVTPLPFRRLT